MSADQVPAAELSALDSRGTGMRIRFIWQGDRYGHQIDAVDGSLSRTLLESIEGDQLADWPPSPPLQHVSVSWIASDTEHGHVAMLAGATSTGHWSICVSARDRRTYSRNKLADTKLYLDEIYLGDDEPDDPELFFDIACRANDAPQFLGSTYRVLYQRVLVSESLNCAFVPGDAPGLVLAPQDAEIELDAKHAPAPILRSRATEIRFSKFPATVRWQYAVRRSSGGLIRVASKMRPTQL